MCVCVACTCVCVLCVCLVSSEIRRECQTDPLELELWMVVSHYVAFGNQTVSSAKAKVLLTTEPSLRCH